MGGVKGKKKTEHVRNEGCCPRMAPAKSTQHWEQRINSHVTPHVAIRIHKSFSTFEADFFTTQEFRRYGCATGSFLQGRRSNPKLVMGCACRVFMGYIGILNSAVTFRPIHWPYMYLNNKVTEKHTVSLRKTLFFCLIFSS